MEQCISQKLVLPLKNPWYWMLNPVTFTGNGLTLRFVYIQRYNAIITTNSSRGWEKKKKESFFKFILMLSSLKDKQSFKNLKVKCESKEQDWVLNQLCNLAYWNHLLSGNWLFSFLGFKASLPKLQPSVCHYSSSCLFCTFNYAKHCKF